MLLWCCQWKMDLATVEGKAQKTNKQKKRLRINIRIIKKSALRYLETTVRSVATRLRIFPGIKVLRMSTFYQLVIYITTFYFILNVVNKCIWYWVTLHFYNHDILSSSDRKISLLSTISSQKVQSWLRNCSKELFRAQRVATDVSELRIDPQEATRLLLLLLVEGYVHGHLRSSIYF